MTTVSIQRRPALPFTVLIRGLQVVGGLVTMYGVTAMLTSDGVQPPNVVVYLGIGLALIASALQRAAGARWHAGWWAYTAALSLSLALGTLPTLGAPECAVPHPPLSPTFYCVSVGAHAAFVAATVVALASLAAGLRSLLRRR